MPDRRCCWGPGSPSWGGLGVYAWLLALLLAAVTVGVAVVAVAVERSTAIGAAVFAVAVFALGIGISLLLIASIPNQNSATAVEHNPSRVIGTEPTWTEERLPRVVSSMSPHSPRLAGLAGLVGMTAAPAWAAHRPPSTRRQRHHHTRRARPRRPRPQGIGNRTLGCGWRSHLRGRFRGIPARIAPVRAASSWLLRIGRRVARGGRCAVGYRPEEPS